MEDAHDNEAVGHEPNTPTVSDSGRTPAEHAEAKAYSRQRLMTDVADVALDLVFLGAMAFALAEPLDQWLAGAVPRDWLRVPVLYVAVTVLHAAVSVPLAFYAGFVVEHRYRMSRLSAAGWWWRYTRRTVLAGLLTLAVFWGLFGVIRLVGPWWWLAAAAGFFLLAVVLGQVAPVWILPLFYRVERIEDDALADRFRRIATGSGLALDGVYRIALSDETAKANAMLAGLGKTRRVLIGDTLLDRFSPDEIDIILAHEVGHHVHRHIVKMISFGAALSVLAFWVCDRGLAAWFQLSHAAEYAGFPPHGLVMIFFMMAIISTLFGPLQNGISRHFERQCDRFALLQTGDKLAYVSAFRKLAQINKADVEPHPLAVLLFHSHPPIAERIAMADS